MSTVKLLAIAGSTRTDSYNKKLVRVAAAAARAAGATVTDVDLRALALPLFDEDYEAAQGPPAAATQLKALMRDNHGFLLSAPEYNSSITAVLKNALDWASRPAPNEPPLVAFRGKVAALFAASPGNLGGLRGLVHVRAILGNIGVLVLPDQIAIPRAHEAFDDAGRLRDEKQSVMVATLARELVTTAQRLHAGT